MKAWCIPAQGKDYEVKRKRGAGRIFGRSGVFGTNLGCEGPIPQDSCSGAREVVGYEVETETRPYILQNGGIFRIALRSRKHDTRCSSRPLGVQKQPGSTIRRSSQHPRGKSVAVSGDGRSGDPRRGRMPPWAGIAGQMIVSVFPPGGSGKGDSRTGTKWAAGEHLFQGQRDPSPEIKQKVAELTASAPTTLAKMQANRGICAERHSVRCNRIGNRRMAAAPGPGHLFAQVWRLQGQGHADERDAERDWRRILLSRHQRAPGRRDTDNSPQMYWFNHEILGIRLPDSVSDSSLMAIYNHPKLGRILIFDPTSEVTPFGQLEGRFRTITAAGHRGGEI